jgi:hypothetical protein
MEEQMDHGKREIASLLREIARVQESFEERIQTEAKSASGRANEVEQHVGEVRSEAEKIRESFGSDNRACSGSTFPTN